MPKVAGKLEFYNKKARFDYQISESFEAGIQLVGPEIKAIRAGKISMISSHIRILGDELFWLGAVIGVGEDNQRTRKLLVKREQIDRLIGKVNEKGNSIVPIKLYFKRGRAKLEVGVGRGKKKWDKRETIKLRDFEREQGRKFTKTKR